MRTIAMSREAKCFFLAIICVLPGSRNLVAQSGPVNPDFEEGELGTPPPGWHMSGAAPRAYSASLTDENPKIGARCAVIRPVEGVKGGGFGTLMQSFDAAPYRAMMVRFSAAVRVEGKGARAQLWLRVDRWNGMVGFFDNMQDRPIKSSKWQNYKIVGVVDGDAQRINLGIIVYPKGVVWMDNASFEIVPLRK